MESKKLTGYPSIDKPWMKYYTKSRNELQLPKCKVYDLIYENNKDHLNDVALIYYGRKITFADMFDSIEKAASAFSAIGVRQGDTVVISSANIPEVIYAFYALNRLGAIVNMVDPRTDLEHSHEYIKEMDSKVVVCISAAYPRIEKAIKDTNVERVVVISPADSLPFLLKIAYKIKDERISVKGGISWNTFLKIGRGTTFTDAPYQEQEVCAVAHTGGTTGNPKSVMLTNNNLNSVTYGYQFLNIPFKRGQVYFNDLPPFIMYGLVLGIHTTLAYGLQVVIYPIFDSEGFPKQFVKYKPQHFSAVPEHLRYLAESSLTKDMDLSFFLSPGVGGDSVNTDLERKVNKYLQEHGCQYEVCKGYGMTELAATACITFKGANAIGSIGVPFITNVFKIVNTETNEECPYNVIGEIWISGPSIMLGYYNDQEATDAIIHIDTDGQRWIKTGDLGLITEDGLIFHKGRIRRLYLTDFGNQPAKIFPLAVEEQLKQCPDVKDCCVVGRPKNGSSSYELVAYIVKADNFVKDNTIKDVLKLLSAEKLPEYMQPVEYCFIDALPLTPVGKVDFRKLEERATQLPK